MEVIDVLSLAGPADYNKPGPLPRHPHRLVRRVQRPNGIVLRRVLWSGIGCRYSTGFTPPFMAPGACHLGLHHRGLRPR